jgi:hypothetical protein
MRPFSCRDSVCALLRGYNIYSFTAFQSNTSIQTIRTLSGYKSAESTDQLPPSPADLLFSNGDVSACCCPSAVRIDMQLVSRTLTAVCDRHVFSWALSVFAVDQWVWPHYCVFCVWRRQWLQCHSARSCTVHFSHSHKQSTAFLSPICTKLTNGEYRSVVNLLCCLSLELESNWGRQGQEFLYCFKQSVVSTKPILTKAAVSLLCALLWNSCTTEFCPNMPATSTDNTGKIKKKMCLSLCWSLPTTQWHNGLTCLLPMLNFAHIDKEVWQMGIGVHWHPHSSYDSLLTDFHEARQALQLF